MKEFYRNIDWRMLYHQEIEGWVAFDCLSKHIANASLSAIEIITIMMFVGHCEARHIPVYVYTEKNKGA